MRDAYHIDAETEASILNHIARIMDETYEAKYPYGIYDHSGFLVLLEAALPELRIWASRNANLGRETVPEGTEVERVPAALEQENHAMSNPTANERIGPSIKRLRIEYEWSLRTLADRSGVTFSYLHALESGKQNNPSLTHLCGIASAFGLTIDELIYGREPVRKQWWSS